MKFMLNGALTIGTLDGANVEIRDEAGAENFFLFGLTVEEVERIKREGYRPMDVVGGDPELAAVLDLIAGGMFSHGDTSVFRPVVDNLRFSDPFLVLADYASYLECQDRVSAAWRDRAAWTRMSILNTARSGKFSSDRAVAQYCDEIWNVAPRWYPWRRRGSRVPPTVDPESARTGTAALFDDPAAPAAG